MSTTGGGGQQQKINPEDLVVRLRGLPWSATEDDLKQFLGPAGSSVKDVHFTLNREGRPSGEAFISLTDETAYHAALAKDHDNMGHRYVEVFASRRAEMDHVVQARGKSNAANLGNDDGIVRLRGLPFGCTKEEIANFFLGMEVFPNGIILPYDRSGRSTGEAYVCFVDRATSDKALLKHMSNIQHRYIEVFRSSRDELESALRKMTSMDNNNGYGGSGSSWRPSPYEKSMRGGQRGNYSMYGGGSYYDDPWGDRGRDAGYGDYGGGGGGYGGSYGGMGSRGPRDGGGPIRERGRYARAGGYGGGGYSSGGAGSGAHCVRMRGLPWDAREQDVAEFFQPLRVVRVTLGKEARSGRPSGEAKVEFVTHNDAVEAMKRDRQHMGHRYVELFLESRASGRMSGYQDFTSDFP